MPRALFGSTALQNMVGRLTSPRFIQHVAEPGFRVFGRRALPCRIDLEKVHSVLVVRTDEIGDLILTTPLLRELRRNLPAAHIALVVKPGAYELVQYCPYVNEVLTFGGETSAGAWEFAQPGRHGRALCLAAHTMWGRRFDLALVPRWDSDYNHAAFVAYFSGAGWRVGYSRHVSAGKFQRNDGLDGLLTHLLHDPLPKHEVQHNLDLLRFVGGTVERDVLELWLTPEDRQFAQDFLQRQEGGHGLLVGMALGAGHPKRVWPAERFAEVARGLMEGRGAHIVLIGGHEDRPLVDEFLRALGPGASAGGAWVRDAVGRTTLRQTAALLARCRLFVGNDSGPLHMAAAVGTRCVEVSCHPLGGGAIHYNSPVRFRPWGVAQRVIQPAQATDGCRDVGACEEKMPHCILGITPSEVRQHALDLLL